MSEQTIHPNLDDLSAFSLGQLSEERAVVVENHIQGCQPCCETIIGLSSDDTFLALLKEAKALPQDQTVVCDETTSSNPQDVPGPLTEHPRYEIIGFIGKGGMGDVYKARHRMMDRTVAIKVIRRELIRKPEAVSRFQREVKSAAQLSHPYVVTAFDAEQAGNVHFMVMEYVEGSDLFQLVQERGPLPIAEACDYIQKAAIGLQHAHERGLVHRDMKPHNLMVTPEGKVKILDFGLASLAPEAFSVNDTFEESGDLTNVGRIMGTPDFISPEQALDARQADIRSDIYSLGATLYFLLAGRPPFAGGSVTQKLKNHVQFEPDALESQRNDIPVELAVVVSKMIAKDPQNRFQTPAAVAEALALFSPTATSTLAQKVEKTMSHHHRIIPAIVLAIPFAVMAAYPGELAPWNGPLFESIFRVPIFVGWVCYMIYWIRSGVVIPRHIHIIALASTCVGIGIAIGLTAAEIITLKLALALVGIPGTLTYFGWFWIGDAQAYHESVE